MLGVDVDSSLLRGYTDCGFRAEDLGRDLLPYCFLVAKRNQAPGAASWERKWKSPRPPLNMLVLPP